MTFESLGLAIKEVGERDPHAMTDDELSDAVVELARKRDALEAEHARLADAWNGRHAWAASGARSGAAWLARNTRHPKQDCGALLWLGDKADRMPLVAAAWAAGDISADHVRRLAKARNQRTVGDFARDEAMLVDLATRLRFDHFARAVDYWHLHADPDGATKDHLERADRRRVSLDQTINNMWSGSTLLDPIGGAIVSRELRRIEQRLFDHDRAEAKQRLHLQRDPLPHELARTPDQRRADALIEMAQRSASLTTNTHKPARILLSVLMGDDTLRQLCQLDDGTVIAPNTLKPWIDHADIERILFAGRSRVIDVSRKRDFTGALRRLIQVRDRECFHPYCDTPAPHCQVDHIQPWAAGGWTEQANGRLACGNHNRARHQRPPPPAD